MYISHLPCGTSEFAGSKTNSLNMHDDVDHMDSGWDALHGACHNQSSYSMVPSQLHVYGSCMVNMYPG